MASTEFTHSAADVEVRIDGVKFNLLEDINGTVNGNLQGISGIGDDERREHAHTVVDYTFTLNGYIEKDEPGFNQAMFPRNARDYRDGRSFTVEIFKKNGPLLEKYIRAKCNTVSTSLRAHAFYMKNAQFVAVTREGNMVG